MKSLIYVKMLPYLGIGFIIPYTAFLLVGMTSLELGAIIISLFIVNPIAYFIVSFIYGRKNKSIFIFPLLIGIISFVSISTIMGDLGYKAAPIYAVVVLIGCLLGKAWNKDDKSS